MNILRSSVHLVGFIWNRLYRDARSTKHKICRICLSVHPYVYPCREIRHPTEGVSLNMILRIFFPKFSWEVSSVIKRDKNNGHFTWRHVYIYMKTRLHLHEDTFTFTWRHVYIYMKTRLHLYEDTFTFTWTHVYIYMKTRLHLHEHTSTFIWTHVYIYMKTRSHLNEDTFTFTWRHVYIYDNNSLSSSQNEKYFRHDL